jgi:hypothetical protein
VGRAPVVDRLEALALVLCEREVDLRGRNDAGLGDLDDRPRLPVLVLDDVAVTDRRRRLLAGEPGRRGLGSGEDRRNEATPQIGARIPEPELR